MLSSFQIWAYFHWMYPDSFCPNSGALRQAYVNKFCHNTCAQGAQTNFLWEFSMFHTQVGVTLLHFKYTLLWNIFLFSLLPAFFPVLHFISIIEMWKNKILFYSKISGPEINKLYLSILSWKKKYNSSLNIFLLQNYKYPKVYQIND